MRESGCSATPAITALLRPGLPGRLVGVPEVLEQAHVAKRVHALPEALVLVGRKLPLLGQSLERLALKERAVPIDESRDLGLEHEEAAVDPALADLRLLGEMADQVGGELQAAEPG